ncbi:MAG: hypothetical protein PHQ80_02585 [Candidatus ainarchaeum sp.]|nr:hypothetical protein [Candidatus ainarchaeum sp.]
MEESGQLLHEILAERPQKPNPTTMEILSHIPANTMDASHSFLLELGLTPEQIASRADLLGRNHESLQRNLVFLKALGLTTEKIATHTALLSRDPDTLQRNFNFLRALGFTPENIESQAALLSRDPDTLQRNFEYLRRFFSKASILKNPSIIGNSQETVEGSVQFLHSLGIDYETYSFVNTTPSCKRHKIAFLLREKFGYSQDLAQEEKKELIAKAREFVRRNPFALRFSEKRIKEKFCTKIPIA